eukprot:6272341-Pyramimonas_sp.AAC.1
MYVLVHLSASDWRLGLCLRDRDLPGAAEESGPHKEVTELCRNEAHHEDNIAGHPITNKVCFGPLVRPRLRTSVLELFSSLSGLTSGLKQTCRISFSGRRKLPCPWGWVICESPHAEQLGDRPARL